MEGYRLHLQAHKLVPLQHFVIINYEKANNDIHVQKVRVLW